MDKLTIISGCLFLAADIFAIASLANPDWINTGESAAKQQAVILFVFCNGEPSKSNLPASLSCLKARMFLQDEPGAPE
ncbi:modulator of smoothened protein isoform X2 [Varanus komodoensis]|uniref:modulator of smoothened protein isoform X2 n=1 Tax=Varanus komodoensis TaxID=61221 RepID=UPI001CF7E627|nr:modulator of smoothened protein isoform X2 [Varanus komodoensis]